MNRQSKALDLVKGMNCGTEIPLFFCSQGSI